MKTIGIEIDNDRIICFVLNKNPDGTIINLTGDFKYLKIKDDKINSELQEFQSIVHTYFDGHNADRIAIISRQAKGKFSSSATSFKLEALIQCYKGQDIEFVSPQAINSFYKKNDFLVDLTHNYQEKAARLSNLLLS